MSKVKKSTKKRRLVARKAGRKKSVKKTARKAPHRTAKRRLSWLDEATQTPRIEAHARKLDSFVAALADGVVQRSELQAQERRLAKLMKAIEPRLNDALHSSVTELLCELTAYDIMQVLHSMHATRPKTAFRG